MIKKIRQILNDGWMIYLKNCQWAGGLALVIWESVWLFRGLTPQLSGCETPFLKLGSLGQLGSLLLYKPPCDVATSLPDLLEAISGLAVEFSRLGDFNLPSMSLASEAAQVATMGLFQISSGPTKRWSPARYDLTCWSNGKMICWGICHYSPCYGLIMVSLRCSYVLLLRREARSI